MIKTAPKKRTGKFLIAMLLYALIFLGITALGLTWFWSYIESYELSRPETAMNSYMEHVDAEYLCTGGADPVIETVDLRIQSREACLDYIKSTLTEEIHYACKMNECTEDKMVYMVMCGERGVCKVTLVPQPADRYGFSRWAVAAEEFDLSYIKPSTAVITAPNYCSVRIGDTCLDESYVTEAKIIYPELKEYYNSYSPPYLVTYRSGAFLGDLSFEVTDPAGNPVTINSDTNMTSFINNCTPEQNAQLEQLVDSYIRGYVDFLSCTGNDLDLNYQNLLQYVVPGCELAKRFQAALSGMYWVNDRHSSVTDLTLGYRVDLGNGRFLCTVSYGVDTHLLSGPSHEVSNVHLIISATDAGMKVESMDIQ